MGEIGDQRHISHIPQFWFCQKKKKKLTKISMYINMLGRTLKYKFVIKYH